MDTKRVLFPAQSDYTFSGETFPISEFKSPTHSRPEIIGKFFFLGGKKLYLRGVSYGAFIPDDNKEEYHDLAKIDADFSMMASYGINTVRIPHTTPPRALLDIAYKHKLWVMTGLSAEQYVGYLIDKKKAPDIDELIREKVRICKGHPALLAISLGNEIPASIARWIGKKGIEKYLQRIYQIVKQEDPGALVTYVNYPTTEYLHLPFLDFLSFNVYLEQVASYTAYLSRLQNISADRPLVMSEIGLDSIRNGEEQQAQFLHWQILRAFDRGVAGLIVFSWTDEWFRGGEEVYDWSFGLTNKIREPKPSLEAVKNAFDQVPAGERDWPYISVIVCTYNGSATLKECLDGLSRLEYANFEVIVINDGSTDRTAEILSAYNFRVLNVENGGLSRARNLGLEQSNGEIVAYLDDDAIPDPHWLTYLAIAFLDTDFVAIGGPNLPPGNVNLIADCVNHSPGTPTHVLLSDQIAEHIPGCNMAFRKSQLKQVGYFDPQFRSAGDDVDVCWKLQEMGWEIGFHPGAQVLHHRRNSLKGYWKQQFGYGKAEAMLEKKWPEKYNTLGHQTWAGRIYSKVAPDAWFLRNGRVYHGMWGSAPFQSTYEPSVNGFLSIFFMPEWYLFAGLLFALSAIGVAWRPMLLLLPLSFLAALLPLINIGIKVHKATKALPQNRKFSYRIRFGVITFFLHILQPFARLMGRMKMALTPWRKYGSFTYTLPYPRTVNVWCEDWQDPMLRLHQMEQFFRSCHLYINRGGAYDRWDLELKGGVFGFTRMIMAAEDHPINKQLLRFRLRPYLSSRTKYILYFSFFLAGLAIWDHEWIPFLIIMGMAAVLVIRSLMDSGIAMSCCIEVFKKQGDILKQ